MSERGQCNATRDKTTQHNNIMDGVHIIKSAGRNKSINPCFSTLNSSHSRRVPLTDSVTHTPTNCFNMMIKICLNNIKTEICVNENNKLVKLINKVN